MTMIEAQQGQVAKARPIGRFRTWLCKNSRRYNRTRNFGLYGHAESKKTQKFVFRSALRPNQILFSHDQEPKRTWAGRQTPAESVENDPTRTLHALNCRIAKDSLDHSLAMARTVGGTSRPASWRL